MKVMLDNHGDMVGSQGCGNGVPTWFQRKYASELIGKPLETKLPYSLISSISVYKTGGYEHCGDNATSWAAHAGDPNYNLLNECCQAMNSGNPGGLGFTTISQQTMDAVVNDGAGRADFVRFWRLVAEAVKGHPSAFGFELSKCFMPRKSISLCARVCLTRPRPFHAYPSERAHDYPSQKHVRRLARVYGGDHHRGA